MSSVRMRSALIRSILLSLLLCLCQPASAYMKLIRQGTDSAEIPNQDDAHGRAVAAGDFDGDGYDDLAMGAPDESNGIGDIYIHGGIVISYGSPAGLTHTGADWITVGDLGIDDVRYGRALAAADFDQDGYDDLAVGLPYLDLPLVPATDAGQVWIHYGGPTGLSSVPGTVLDQSILAGAAAEDFDIFGFALCTGLFNDDVYPDLAVGSIGEDGNAGAVFYFYGSNSGVTLSGFGFFKQVDLGESPEINAWLGYALTANDFDGNGFDDLAIGAPKKTVASLTTAGRVYVVYSTATGLSSSFVDTYDSVGLGVTAQSDAWFGAALSSGNYWVQKASFDLAIGEPQYDYFGDSDAGRVLILRFDPPPTKAEQLSKKMSPNDIRILVQTGFGDENPEPGDQFGYALASGETSGDTLDDIAIGAPFEAINLPGQGNMFSSGSVDVFDGNVFGPAGFPDRHRVLDLNSENDHTLGGEQFGMALAFGSFDDSGREALAIGAPGRDYEDYLDGGTDISDAGAVYISAPWRQPVDRPHRSSVVYDCDQNVVYAQRPFDLVNPASTTKAMTLLLACEAVQTNFIEWDYPYVVDWSRPPNIGGSLVPLYPAETMEFHNLMKTMMTVSGNDAGYALGDAMTGEVAVWDKYETTLPAFANLMNNRASQLGLSGNTFMNNPSGMDYGSDPQHRTHAMDWVKLARGAMQNQCARDIVGEYYWEVPRDLAGGVDAYMNLGPAVKTDFYNSFVKGLQSGGFPATGVKGGSTPSAWRTGLGSASALGGEAYAAWFGVRDEDNPPGAPKGDLTGTGRDLLAVGRAACELDLFSPPPPGPPTPFGLMDGLTTELGFGQGMCFSLLDQDGAAGDPQALTVSTVARVLDGATADFRLALLRTSTADTRPSETIALNFGKIDFTEDMEIQNMGDTAVDLSVIASHPTGASWSFNIAPGATAVVPPATVGGQDYQIALTNDSRDATASLSLRQLGILAAGQVGDGITAPATHTMDTSVVGGSFTNDQLCVYMAGQDSAPGSLVTVSAHPTGSSTPVLEELPEASRGGAGLRLLANSPNPFNPATTLRFELDNPRRVDLKVFNLAGRLVRVLESGTPFVAGEHSVRWNGRDDGGRVVASGVYVVQIRAGDESASQRVALLK